MSAGRYNIICEAGATLTRQLLWKDGAGNPVNLTNYTARMQVKFEAVQTAALLLELSTANGRITLGGILGTIALNVAAIDTRIVPGRYLYDLEMEAIGGKVTRLVSGAFVVVAEVTT